MRKASDNLRSFFLYTVYTILCCKDFTSCPDIAGGDGHPPLSCVSYPDKNSCQEALTAIAIKSLMIYYFVWNLTP